MKLIDAWNYFWRQDAYNPISPNAKVLYMSLLAIFNRSQWKSNKLGISNGMLSGMSGLSEKQLPRFRTELEKAGLIMYTPGKKNAAPKYELTDFGSMWEQSESDNGSDTGTIRELSEAQSESNNGEKAGTYIEKEREEEKEKEVYIPPLSPQGGKSPEAKRRGASDSVKLDKLIDEQPEELQEPLREFVKMRTRIKKPLTPHALELNIKQLYRMSGDPKERVDIVEQSVMRSYQGFFPVGRAREEPDVFTQVINGPDVFTQAINEPW